MLTWKIENLIVKPQDGAHTDVVVTAAWRCTAEQAGHSASNYGAIGFASPAGKFTDYADLTEATVLGWVWASGVDKVEVEASVRRELADKVTPPTILKPLPWAG